MKKGESMKKKTRAKKTKTTKLKRKYTRRANTEDTVTAPIEGVQTIFGELGKDGNVTDVTPDKVPSQVVFELVKQFAGPNRGIAMMVFAEDASPDLFYMHLSVKDVAWLASVTNAEFSKLMEDSRKKAAQIGSGRAVEKSCAQDLKN